MTQPQHDERVSFADSRTAAGVRTAHLNPPLTVDPSPADRALHEPAPRPAPSSADTLPGAPGLLARRGIDLGAAPLVLAMSAVGVLVVAMAYADGRDAGGGGMVAYWIGQVLVFTPVVARLLSRHLRPAEPFLLVIGLAVNQYFLKWMYSPDQFRFPDELQHWLATTLIMDSGRLFQANPALPPAVHFPGLAEMGAAVAALTGLPVTAAGLIVAGVAHLVFVGALYVTVARASGSSVLAALTCVLYATALHYLFFNSMYLYQVAALPFLMLTVWASQRWRAGGGPPFAAIAVLAMVVTIVGHHVTAFVTVATLTLLAGCEVLTVGRPRRWAALWPPAAALVIVALWVALVAREVIDYLTAPLDRIGETIAVMLSRGETSEAAPVASVAPWQLAVQAIGLLTLLSLFLAVGQSMLRRHDRDPWRWAALIGATTFFAGNGVRFLGASGPEIAGRLSTFTYVPISIVAAAALLQAGRWLPRRPQLADLTLLRGLVTRARAAQPGPALDTPYPVVDAPAGLPALRRVLVGSVIGTVLLVGARAGGWPPVWALLPGPYLVAGFERSVDASGLAATDWARTTLGPGNRFGGDITAVALTSTYGRQDPVRESSPLFVGDRWGLADENLATTIDLDYLWVDRRLTEQVPASGAYFERDPRAGRYTEPLAAGVVTKFDTAFDLERVYDNGDIRIYRMGTP
jgi:hypothetical protein